MRDNDGNDRYGDECDGVDINRNYPLEWSHNTQGQAVIGDDLEVEFTVDDDNPCSDVYHGPRDFFDDDGDCDDDDDDYDGGCWVAGGWWWWQWWRCWC